MSYKRILTVQDISCVGQCSLTVALPILSACGMETAILPSAVLSTHTGGFKGYTFCDLTDEMPKILAHWQKEGIRFAALYTGYLGSSRQIDYVCQIKDTVLAEGAPLIVDPAMADNGKLYPGFDDAFVDSMKKLVAKSDIVLPNITEACFLTGTEYRDSYDEAYIDLLFERLAALGVKNIVLTGVSYSPDSTGVAVYESGKVHYYSHIRYEGGCHGTGDVYASAFTGALMNGRSLFESAKLAADYTLRCIEATALEDNHWYGAAFEKALPSLIKVLDCSKCQF